MHILKALPNILNSKYVQNTKKLYNYNQNQFLKLTVLYLLLKPPTSTYNTKTLENWGQIQKIIVKKKIFQ